MTTTDQRDHRKLPVLFNVDRDPGERFPVKTESDEYLREVGLLMGVAAEHEQGMVRAKPQLNWCDKAVKVKQKKHLRTSKMAICFQNWAPPGCDKIGDCMKIPKSKPELCFWPH